MDLTEASVRGIFSRAIVAIGFAGGLLGLPAELSAQPAAAVPPHDFNTYRPTASATQITPEEAPTIDGAISEPIWDKAQIIDEFYQVDPRVGIPPTKRTVVRILHDGANLYVSIYAYDDPDNITATVKNRDAFLITDDSVRINIDPSLSRRNGYSFEMNPLGVRVDGLIQNNTTFLKEWNTIWNGKAKIVADGYTVEMVIPFRSLAFDPSKSDWGLQLWRQIRRTGERIQWSSISTTGGNSDLSRIGTLTGVCHQPGDWPGPAGVRPADL